MEDIRKKIDEYLDKITDTRKLEKILIFVKRIFLQ